MIKASAIDLFCGVGGLTHGIIKAGIPVLAGIDIDLTCRYAYEKNNRAQFIGKDVAELTSEEILQLYPEDGVKIMLGCAPCQPFSNYTNKKKDRDKDHKWPLLYSFSRLVQEIEPEIVSMENVPQIEKEKVFKDFVMQLQLLGYYVSWKVVYCPDYQIPQIRKRMVLLASKLGKINLIKPTASKDSYITVREVIGDLEEISAGETSSNDPLHRASKLNETNMKRMMQSRPGGTWADWDPELVADCHAKASGETYMSVYARMEWEKPSPTITTQFYGFGNGRFGHPVQHRALSLREGAMLQTFPRSYDFLDPETTLSFKKIGTHIGNAVPVRLGEVIGQSIVSHLEECGGKKDAIE